MNWLTEVSGRAQDWQQRLETAQREVATTLGEPGQTLKDALPGVMTALQALEQKVTAALLSAKDLETAVRNAPQGVK